MQSGTKNSMGESVRRTRPYVGFVLLAGLCAGAWFTVTEEVDPAATEPGAYGFFRVVTVALAVVAATVACGLCEVVYRLARRR